MPCTLNWDLVGVLEGHDGFIEITVEVGQIRIRILDSHYSSPTSTGKAMLKTQSMFFE